MIFLNPPMLAGLAAALVPLVVHLLNRARYRNIDWAAMMFLDAMEPRADRSAKLKQWLLLGVRCSMVGLLGFALARPVLNSHGVPPQLPGRTAAVIILDRSSSMSLNDNGRPRIDQARDTIYQLLAPGFHRGDDLWLVPLGDGDMTPAYTTDPQDMARRVRETPSPSGVVDIASGLERALDLLTNSTAANHEIYIVADRQASTWSHIDQEFANRWRQRIESISTRPRIILAPVGTDEADNVALISIRPLYEPLIKGQAADVEVVIRNFGSVPRASLSLGLELQSPTGQRTQVGQKSFSVPALSAVAEIFRVKFGDPGCYVLTAKLDAPGIASDKLLNTSLDVIKPIRILIIDGDEREGDFQSASDFLRAALAPYKDLARNPFRVDVVHPQMWASTDLSPYQVVMLTNLSTFSETQAMLIEHFAFDGGGVIVIPGDQSRTENYNSQLTFLPGVLSPAIPESDSGATDIGNIDASLGLFKFPSSRGESGSAVMVRRYFPLAPRPGASVLGSFGDGRPFLITTAAGRGRVLLATTPVDPDWNALPLTPLFLPLAQAMVSYVAAAPSLYRQEQWNVVTGRPLLAHLDGQADKKNVHIDLSGSPLRTPPVLAISPLGSDMAFLGADRPGVYRVSTHGPASDADTIRFSVRTPLEESELTPLTSSQSAQLTEWLDAVWADPDRRPVAATQEASRAGWVLWMPLLGGVMVIAVLELAATRRWAGRNG